MRDVFLLALEHSGRDHITVVVEDSPQKPDIDVRRADKMVPSEKVDVLTGIIRSNLAMAVVPSVVAQGKCCLSRNAGPSLLGGPGCDKRRDNVAWQNDAIKDGGGHVGQ